MIAKTKSMPIRSRVAFLVVAHRSPPNLPLTIFAVRDPDITAPSKLGSSENSQNREALREVRRWIFVTLGE
jgi:hypothetical protein